MTMCGIGDPPRPRALAPLWRIVSPIVSPVPPLLRGPTPPKDGGPPVRPPKQTGGTTPAVHTSQRGLDHVSGEVMVAVPRSVRGRHETGRRGFSDGGGIAQPAAGPGSTQRRPQIVPRVARRGGHPTLRGRPCASERRHSCGGCRGRRPGHELPDRVQRRHPPNRRLCISPVATLFAFHIPGRSAPRKRINE